MPRTCGCGWSCPGFVDTSELGRKGVSTMPKSRRPYPPEFRARLVELVRKGRTPEELGRQFEPSAQAIRNWVKQAALVSRGRARCLESARDRLGDRSPSPDRARPG